MTVAQFNAQGDVFTGGVVVHHHCAALDRGGQMDKGEVITCMQLAYIVAVGKNQRNNAVIDEVLLVNAGKGFGDDGFNAEIKGR